MHTSLGGSTENHDWAPSLHIVSIIIVIIIIIIIIMINRNDIWNKSYISTAVIKSSEANILVVFITGRIAASLD